MNKPRQHKFRVSNRTHRRRRQAVFQFARTKDKIFSLRQQILRFSPNSPDFDLHTRYFVLQSPRIIANFNDALEGIMTRGVVELVEALTKNYTIALENLGTIDFDPNEKNANLHLVPKPNPST